MNSYGATEEGQELLPKQLTAREAFLSRDIEASRMFHERKAQDGAFDLEHHGDINAGELKSAVFGGLDGIITTMATISSVAGANLAPIIILIVGIAHLFADGFSMGIGDALSSKAEIDYNNAEREREKWEMEVGMESEINEMIELYERRGIAKDDATQIWTILAKYPTAFLDVMMVEELHLLPPDENDCPWRGGVITCLSFMLFGLVPLLPFLAAMIPYFPHQSTNTQMVLSHVFSILTLFILGVLKAKLIGVGESQWKSGLFTAGLGGAAALVSFLAGAILQYLFDVQM